MDNFCFLDMKFILKDSDCIRVGFLLCETCVLKCVHLLSLSVCFVSITSTGER